jgi:hypothetical protein
MSSADCEEIALQNRPRTRAILGVRSSSLLAGLMRMGPARQALTAGEFNSSSPISTQSAEDIRPAGHRIRATL